MIHPTQLASRLGQLLLNPRPAPPAAPPSEETSLGRPVKRDSVEISAEARRLLAARAIPSTEAIEAQDTDTTTQNEPGQGAETATTVPADPGTTAATGTEASPTTAPGTEELSSDDEQQVTELKQRDGEVRTHEQAHKAAGGQYAGAISYSYTTGPDGKRYAAGGSVPIDSSPVEGDARATVKKMQQVIAAANAPADPSGADRQIAAGAARQLREAQQQSADESGTLQPGSEKSGSAQAASVEQPSSTDPSAPATRVGAQAGALSALIAANQKGVIASVRSVGSRMDTFA